TLTGSIGVIINYHTFEELFGKIGVGTETVKSGDLKDVGTYSRSMTKEEELMLRSVVMDAYEQFVEAVSEGRGMDKEDVYPVADGSIFTGLQAYNLGLIDSLGGLKEAVDLAADLAELEGEPKIVRPYHRKKVTLWDLLGSLLRGLPVSISPGSYGPELLYLYQ
ncbi:MAG: S49 family peptidase, partial [Candidatus Zixiibacteriota bacterium]